MLTDKGSGWLQEHYGDVVKVCAAMTNTELVAVIADPSRFNMLSCCKRGGYTRGETAEAVANELRRRGS